MSDDRAQDTYEYILVVGVVVVGIAAGLLALDLVIRLFVGLVCPSVDTANALVAVGSCISS